MIQLFLSDNIENINRIKKTYRMPLLLLLVFLPTWAKAQVSVITQHNNNFRTGLNANEKKLTTSNVNKNTFGKIGSFPVDDQVYAQPLIVSNLDLPGIGKKNVLFVGTVNNSLYAFDANDLTGASSFWAINLTGSGERPVKNTDFADACNGNYKDFSGNIGIVGTPVIDTLTQTLYVVAKSYTQDAVCNQRLHAINIFDGTERPGSPVLISGIVKGTGSGIENDSIKFRAMTENQRPALLHANGNIYIAWGGHCDSGPFHGWVMAYDPVTLKQKAVYNNTRNGHGAGIWMSGQGPSADEEGNIYVTCGNGTLSYKGNSTDTSNLGDSFIKLTPDLRVKDWFTPYNFQFLEDNDLDFGSSGALLIPNSNMAVSGGKEGVLYVVNRNDMGKLSAGQNDDQIIQSFLLNNTPNNIHGSAAYYQGPESEYIYVWAEYDHCKAFKLDRGSGKFILPYASQSPMRAPDGMPGGMISVSSNGTAPGTGIVWATHPFTGNANWETRPGILRAFDATDLSNELWNTKQDSVRDDFGNFAKFCYPTIANGRVYLATFSDQVVVYGLLEDLTGVRSAYEDVTIVLSPVPVSDYLDIRFNSGAGKVEVTISDIHSRVVLRQTENTSGNTIRMYLGDLANGVYFVTIWKEEMQIVKRVTVFR